ncbi:unnamed protein product, partial [marine sediment metagenome]
EWQSQRDQFPEAKGFYTLEDVSGELKHLELLYSGHGPYGAHQ